MSKRSEDEKREDALKIKKAAKSCSTLAEISKKTGLSYYKIKKVLDDTEILNSVKVEKKDIPTNVSTTVKKYVVDASFTGNVGFREKINKIITSDNSILILTSVTLKELNKLQKQEKMITKAYDARELLNIILENPEHTEVVQIDEDFEIADDAILNYCSKHEDIILITSDKEMALKARLKKINIEYVKYHSRNDSRIFTFTDARYSEGRLLIENLQTENKSISVFSNNIKYAIGSKILNIGDDVFICKKHWDYITFSHYKVLSLDKEKNCTLEFSTRIYNDKKVEKISKLKNQEYKKFINEFYLRFN